MALMNDHQSWPLGIPLLQLPKQPLSFSDPFMDTTHFTQCSANTELMPYSLPEQGKPHFVQPYEQLMGVLYRIDQHVVGQPNGNATQVPAYTDEYDHSTVMVDDCIFPKLPLLQIETQFPTSGKENEQSGGVLPLLQWAREGHEGHYMYHPDQPNLLSPDLLFQCGKRQQNSNLPQYLQFLHQFSGADEEEVHVDSSSAYSEDIKSADNTNKSSSHSPENVLGRPATKTVSRQLSEKEHNKDGKTSEDSSGREDKDVKASDKLSQTKQSRQKKQSSINKSSENMFSSISKEPQTGKSPQEGLSDRQQHQHIAIQTEAPEPDLYHGYALIPDISPFSEKIDEYKTKHSLGIVAPDIFMDLHFGEPHQFQQIDGQEQSKVHDRHNIAGKQAPTFINVVDLDEAIMDEIVTSVPDRNENRPAAQQQVAAEDTNKQPKQHVTVPSKKPKSVRLQSYMDSSEEEVSESPEVAAANIRKTNKAAIRNRLGFMDDRLEAIDAMSNTIKNDLDRTRQLVNSIAQIGESIYPEQSSQNEVEEKEYDTGHEEGYPLASSLAAIEEQKAKQLHELHQQEIREEAVSFYNDGLQDISRPSDPVQPEKTLIEGESFSPRDGTHLQSPKLTRKQDATEFSQTPRSARSTQLAKQSENTAQNAWSTPRTKQTADVWSGVQHTSSEKAKTFTPTRNQNDKLLETTIQQLKVHRDERSQEIYEHRQRQASQLMHQMLSDQPNFPEDLPSRTTTQLSVNDKFNKSPGTGRMGSPKQSARVRHDHSPPRIPVKQTESVSQKPFMNLAQLQRNKSAKVTSTKLAHQTQASSHTNILSKEQPLQPEPNRAMMAAHATFRLYGSQHLPGGSKRREPGQMKTYTDRLKEMKPAQAGNKDYGPSQPGRTFKAMQPYDDPYTEQPESDSLSKISSWSVEEEAKRLLYGGESVIESFEATHLDLSQLSLEDTNYTDLVSLTHLQQTADAASISSTSVMSVIDWSQVEDLIADVK